MKTATTITVLSLGFCISLQAASLNWGVQTLSSPSRITGFDDANLDIATGDYAQLVYLGADDTFNGVDASGNLTGDDKLISGPVNIGPLAGRTPVTTANFNYTDCPVGNYFVVVAFDSSTVAGGSVPEYYGVSANFTIASGWDSTPGDWATPGFKTDTALPVPEPGTMALALVGMGAMALRRRFKKKA